MSDMFKPVYKDSHTVRLARIRKLAPKEYLDDGPMALYHAMINMRVRDFHSNVEYCLLELERLYNLQPWQEYCFQLKAKKWFTHLT